MIEVDLVFALGGALAFLIALCILGPIVHGSGR